MKKVLSIVMCTAILLSFCSLGLGVSAAESYRIVSPYEDVVWSGDGAWGAYRGNLHSHTTYSDADVDLASMVKEYYKNGYDFLANSDHAVTGVEWNKAPARMPIYAYQAILGNKQVHLTDEEYEAITTGTYNGRGKKMVCVVGANELNNHSLSKNHVNGYFLPQSVGNGFGGVENEKGYEKAVKFVDKNGGLSHINHPGDWIDSNRDPQAVNDRKNIELFGNIILKYDSCLGMEVLNDRNSTTKYDRVLWDNVLMYTLPYGKTVIGFSNTDAHNLLDTDSSFSVFMMKENNVDNIKKTMQSGAFFGVTKILPGNDFEIGPKDGFDLRGKDVPYPMFKSLTVDGHKITATTENASEIQFIANGKVIAKGETNGEAFTLDLDSVENAKDLLYVRVEIKG
ncbi:MAG: hypothetical protein K6F09_06510, partial [Clostridiales bacterium]|nr:hypothetical protein [Clostridiales bacterium]